MSFWIRFFSISSSVVGRCLLRKASSLMLELEMFAVEALQLLVMSRMLLDELFLSLFHESLLPMSTACRIWLERSLRRADV